MDAISWKLYVWVAAGGALGSVTRFWAGNIVARIAAASGFPWGTLLVNVAGCFVIGFFATITGPEGRWPQSEVARQFFMTGVLGGFTTFSAFSWQTLVLAHSGEWGKAGAYVGASLLVCLAAVAAGHAVAAAMR